jgi:hypothetical protein
MNKDYLFKEPVNAFRAFSRKGELRYIASKRSGSLGAISRFAPPTKSIPKLFMKLLSSVDFRIPGVVETKGVSEDFLQQVSCLLDIPADRIGIYVGEPNDKQKLVIIDVDGVCSKLVKVAAGKEADRSIEREAAGRRLAMKDEGWHTLGVSACSAESICGRSAIIMDRVEGRQLTPKEFELLFFENFNQPGAVIGKHIHYNFLNNNGGDSISIGNWLDQSGNSNLPFLKELVHECLKLDALELRSTLGVVHGDFAPWNIIRRAEVGSPKGRQAFGAIDWEFTSANTPRVFDYAYAAWCYSELLGRTSPRVEPHLWLQLVSLGALWKALRGEGSVSSLQENHEQE